jgi:hypothetical protein
MATVNELAGPGGYLRARTIPKGTAGGASESTIQRITGIGFRGESMDHQGASRLTAPPGAPYIRGLAARPGA